MQFELPIVTNQVGWRRRRGRNRAKSACALCQGWLYKPDVMQRVSLGHYISWPWMVKILSARCAERDALLAFISHHDYLAPGYKRGGAISRIPWAPDLDTSVHLRPRRVLAERIIKGRMSSRAYVYIRALPRIRFYSSARVNRALHVAVK